MVIPLTPVVTQEVIVVDRARFGEGVELVDPLFGDVELEEGRLWDLQDLFSLLAHRDHVVVTLPGRKQYNKPPYNPGFTNTLAANYSMYYITIYW